MSAINLFTQSMNTRRASNADFEMQTTANSMLNGVRQAGKLSFGHNNLQSLQEAENANIAKMQTLSLIRKISTAMAESAGRRLDILA